MRFPLREDDILGSIPPHSCKLNVVSLKSIMKKYIKAKAGPELGFRTSDFFKGKRFGGKANLRQGKSNPSQFITQHKGG